MFQKSVVSGINSQNGLEGKGIPFGAWTGPRPISTEEKSTLVKTPQFHFNFEPRPIFFSISAKLVFRLHAHFSAHSACTVTFAHFSCMSHTRMDQGQVHEKCVCRMSVFVLYLAFSLLMLHPSLLFLHAYLDITFLSIFLPYFPVLQAQDMRHSLASRSMATWPRQQTEVMSPRSSTRSLLWTVTRCSLTIHTSMKFLTSRKTHDNTGLFGILSLFESSVSHVSHDDIALQMESKVSMHRDTDCQTGKEKGKRRFCDQCCTVDVKEKSTEQY